jgi:hypothetical protein
VQVNPTTPTYARNTVKMSEAKMGRFGIVLIECAKPFATSQGRFLRTRPRLDEPRVAGACWGGRITVGITRPHGCAGVSLAKDRLRARAAATFAARSEGRAHRGLGGAARLRRPETKQYYNFIALI